MLLTQDKNVLISKKDDKGEIKMDDWQETGWKLVAARAAQSPEYLKLRARQEQLEESFLSIRNKLSPQEQQELDMYIAVCEELLYFESQVAWAVGKEQKKQLK